MGGKTGENGIETCKISFMKRKKKNSQKHFELGMTMIRILPIRKLLIRNKIIINKDRHAN